MPRDEKREKAPAPAARGALLTYLVASVAVAAALLAEFALAFGLLRDHPSHAPGLAQPLYGLLVAGLALLAGQAALVWSRLLRPYRAALLRERELILALDERSHRDALTGVLNRMAFEHLIVRDLETLKRYGVGFCALMLDLDGFRRVNEEHGYEAGDQVLVELAQLLKAHMRKADFLFRWRSGRFLVLASGIGEEQALGLGEKLRELVAGHVFRQGLRLSVCIGVAQAQPEDAPEQLVARVKAALGLAKERGPASVTAGGAPVA
ncbi:MAG: hypothetical protein AUJ49_04305 [Desulfovibrionaceae bacterium CG1_02_65_16]|nr:MAG: hypothetical protein AUJ49_04305 [Desulfovibrionaceae bacterium CG1_02_65_16]